MKTLAGSSSIGDAKMKFIRYAVFSLGMLCCGGVLSAQNSAGTEGKAVPPGLQKKIDAQRQALAAFSKGDSATGLAELEKAIDKGSKASGRDFQVASLLAEQSFLLAEGAKEGDGDPAETLKIAYDLAQLTVERLTSIKGNVSLQQRGQAYALAASLEERVLGNRQLAREYYETALKYSPKNWVAEAGAMRLRGIDQEAKARAKDNEMLMDRASKQHPKG